MGILNNLLKLVINSYCICDISCASSMKITFKLDNSFILRISSLFVFTKLLAHIITVSCDEDRFSKILYTIFPARECNVNTLRILKYFLFCLEPFSIKSWHARRLNVNNK